MHRHRSLAAPPPRARVGFRLQPAPAAALPDQPHNPDSSRAVRHSRSGSMRAGSPPGHQDRGDRSPSVLALIGGWDEVVRRLRKETTFRSDGPGWSLSVAA